MLLQLTPTHKGRVRYLKPEVHSGAYAYWPPDSDSPTHIAFWTPRGDTPILIPLTNAVVETGHPITDVPSGPGGR